MDPNAPGAEPDTNETTDECAGQTLLEAECLDSMIVKLTRKLKNFYFLLSGNF